MKTKWKTPISVNMTEVGETIEEKLRKVLQNKEKIGQEFQLIYTNRKDGVMPEYNIRTDRFDVAQDAKNKLNEYERNKTAKSEEKQAIKE
nr:MAG TPA: hypothetical protein [Microviridae sp.]